MEQGIHITLRSDFATGKIGLPGRGCGDMSGGVSRKSDFVVVLLSPISGIGSSSVCVNLQGLLNVTLFGGTLDGLDNLGISRTSTEISGNRLLDLL